MSSAPVSSSWLEMLAGVISESNRVVSSHSRHFLSLSVIFLLPLSSLLISSPSLLIHLSSSSSSSHPQSLLRSSSSSSSPPPHFPLSLLVTLLVVLLLLLLAFSSVSHSVHRSFFGRSVNLIPSLSSIPLSLLHLLSLSAPIFSLLLLLYLLFAFLPLRHILLIAALSFLPVFYLFVLFSLSFPIAVLEHEWGIIPVIRSAHLIRGMKWASASVILFFVAILGLVFWGFSLGDVKGGIVVPVVVAKTVFGSALMTVMFLYWMVSCVVMYLYCKALHGELAAEIVEEFAWEYVCLPFDEEKVPRVVSVARQRAD